MTNYYGSGKQNDYDKLMSQIESGLYEYHSQLKQNPPPAASQPETGSHSKTDSPQHNEALPVPDYIKAKQPFAKVNQVAPMSPAYEVRIKLNLKIFVRPI